jgi:uncharacterized protein
MRVGLLAGLCLGGLIAGTGFAGVAQAAPPPYPKANGFVVDTAGKVSASDEAALEAELRSYSRRSDNEIAVLVIPTLHGQTVEKYATGVFNAWGIGKKGVNNGVLLLVAMKERKTRLEVGKGLRTVVTNDEATGILRDDVTPELRQGDVFTAVEAGLTALYAELDEGVPTDDSGPYDDTPADGFPPGPGLEPDGSGSGGFEGGFTIVPVLLLGLMALVAFLRMKPASGRTWSPAFGPGGSRAGRRYRGVPDDAATMGSAGIWAGTQRHDRATGGLFDGGVFGGGSSDGGGATSSFADSDISTSSGVDSGSSGGGSDFGGGSSDGGGSSSDW